MPFRTFNDLRLAQWFTDTNDNYLPVIVSYTRPGDLKDIIERYASEVDYAQELVPLEQKRRVMLYWKPTTSTPQGKLKKSRGASSSLV